MPWEIACRMIYIAFGTLWHHKSLVISRIRSKTLFLELVVLTQELYDTLRFVLLGNRIENLEKGPIAMIRNLLSHEPILEEEALRDEFAVSLGKSTPCELIQGIQQRPELLLVELDDNLFSQICTSLKGQRTNHI